MGVEISLVIILVTAIIIAYLGNIFAKSSSKIGDYFHLPRAVKGATFDAIAGSLPELFVVLFSVILFKKFEVGIGTVAGSALFNLLVIPGICVLVAPKVFRVSNKVISRDALFYIVSVFILLILVLYFKVWGFWIAVILLMVYLFYLRKIVGHTKLHWSTKKQTKKSKEMFFLKEIIVFLSTLILIGVSTYFLAKSSIDLSYALNVSPIIIAFTITAAATSIPDAVISIANAKKGNIDDATSNIFGSNIFDILVGLGLPLLIYVIYKGSVEIIFNHIEIILVLLGSTILLLYFFLEEYKLSKREGIILLFTYVLFVAYTIILSLR